MDNAMVKRGIGAVVLAIIAALLLGYLLKDKSRERQDVVDMKLPGAPEINIPSLSEVTDKVTDSAVSIVDDAKDTVSKGGSAVIASATGAVENLTDNVSDGVNAVTDKVTDTVSDSMTATSTASSNPNPGFSFRPPAQNEQKEITKNSGTEAIITPSSTQASDTVVASTTTTAAAPEKENFKPVLEEKKKAPVKKPAKKAVVKATAKPPKTPAASSSTKSGKYSIQLLATSSQSRANKLAKTMTGEGYIAFITQTTRDNKVLYRVRIGGHNNRDAAIKAQSNMKKRYQKNFFVQNSLVIAN